MEKESGASADEVRQEFRAKLTQMMGGESGPYSTAYTYDVEGRVKTKRQRVFNQLHETEITYNEHGDTVSEIARTKQIGESVDGELPRQPEYSETRYSYVYDSFGNWTEQVTTYYSQANGPAQSTTRRLRSLTYY